MYAGSDIRLSNKVIRVAPCCLVISFRRFESFLPFLIEKERNHVKWYGGAVLAGEFAIEGRGFW
jgi:hypothetical protein